MSRQNNNRRIWKASSSLFAASFVSLVINNLVGLWLVRQLELVQYGEIAYFLGNFALIRLFVTLRLDPYVVEMVLRARVQSDPVMLRRTIYSLGLARVALPTGMIGVLACVAGLRNDPVLIWAGLAGFAASLYDFVGAVSQGMQAYRRTLVLYATQPVIYLAWIACLAVQRSLVPGVITAGFSVSYLVAALIAAYLLRLPAPTRDAFARATLQRAFRSIVSLFGFGVLNQFYLSAGTLLFGMAGLKSDAASFGASFSLVALPLNIGFVVAASVFYPEVVAGLAHENADTAWLEDLLHRFLRVFFVGLTIPFALALALADPLIPLLYGTSYSRAVLPFAIMTPLISLLSLQQLYIFALFALHRITYANRAMLIQVLIAIGGGALSLLLGGEWRVPGVALAFLVSASLGGVVMNRALCQSITVRLSWSVLLTGHGLVAGLALITAWIARPVSLILGGICIGLICPLVTVLLTTSASERRGWWQHIHRSGNVSFDAQR